MAIFSVQSKCVQQKMTSFDVWFFPFLFSSVGVGDADEVFLLLIDSSWYAPLHGRVLYLYLDVAAIRRSFSFLTMDCHHQYWHGRNFSYRELESKRSPLLSSLILTNLHACSRKKSFYQTRMYLLRTLLENADSWTVSISRFFQLSTARFQEETQSIKSPLPQHQFIVELMLRKLALRELNKRSSKPSQLITFRASICGWFARIVYITHLQM